VELAVIGVVGERFRAAIPDPITIAPLTDVNSIDICKSMAVDLELANAAEAGVSNVEFGEGFIGQLPLWTTRRVPICANGRGVSPAPSPTRSSRLVEAYFRREFVVG
jgi:hypothetical protein